MIRRIAIVILAATCVPVAAVAQSADAARPIPYPLSPTLDFQRAIDNSTRSTTGEPGANYWQQWTDYQLTAKLFPEQKRVEGSAHIVHHNRSPLVLPALALQLHQNVHAPGAIRNRVVEVTGGVKLARISVGGVPIAERSLDRNPGYQVDGTTLFIRIPQPVAPGDSVAIDIEWSFTVPQAGMGRMGWSRDDLFFIA